MNKSKNDFFLLLYVMILVVWAIISNNMPYYFKSITSENPNKKYIISIQICLIILLLIFFLVLKRYKNFDLSKLKIGYVAAGLASVFIYPTISCDIFYYVSYAILQGKYHLNPYNTAIQDVIRLVSEKPFHILTGATSRTPMTYGYLYSIYLKSLYFISFKNYYIAFYILKIINFICIYYIAKYATKIICYLKPNTNKNLIFIGIALNPLLLIEGIINGHNDIILIFLCIIAIWNFIQERCLVASILFMVGVHIKISILLMLPFAFIYAIKRGIKLKTVVFIILLFLISFLPYGLIYNVWTIPKGILIYQKYSDISFSISILYILYGNINFVPGGISDLISCIQLLFIAFYLSMLAYYIKNNSKNIDIIFKIIMLVYFVYIVIVSPVAYIWYFIWLLPGILCCKQEQIINMSLMLSALDIAYELLSMCSYSIPVTSILIYVSMIIIFTIYYLKDKKYRLC